MYNVLYTHKGTKNVAKQMAKISQGRVRDKRVTWFPELAEEYVYVQRCSYFNITARHREEYQDPSLLVYEELRGKGRPPREPC